MQKQNFLFKAFPNTAVSVILSPGITISRGSFGTSNGRKIARIARILTIFGPNESQRRDLFFEKRSNERRRHRRVVVAAVVAAVVAIIVVVAGFCGDSITDRPLKE